MAYNRFNFASPWAAGADALTASLAERDLQRQKEEDRLRTREVQDRNFDLDRRGVELQERTATEANARAEAAAQAAAGKSEAVRRLYGVFYDAKADPNMRVQAAAHLESLGENPDQTMAREILNPKPTKPETQKVFSTDPRGGTVRQIGEVPTGSHFVAQPAPEKPEKPPAGFKDDPLLPTGVKAWIDTLTQRGLSIADARRELSRGWAQQKMAHPNADLAQAAKYLDSVYPASSAVVPRDPMGATGSAPSVPSSDADARAMEWLKANGAPVTPANIAAWKQRNGGG